jgi:hypothetical protein
MEEAHNEEYACINSVNLGMLIFLLSHQAAPEQASGPEQSVRARALEIVDGQGKVRASLSVVPEGPARRADGSLVKDGKIYPETVLFRLIRPDGRPSVKIETSEQGSALTLGGGIDPTYTVINADGGLHHCRLQTRMANCRS